MWEVKAGEDLIEVAKNTLSITSSLEENNNASFVVNNEDNKIFKRFEPVEINEDSNNIFKGYVQTSNYTLSTAGSLSTNIDIIGQDYILQKRRIVKAFTAKKVGEIVEYIVDNILSEEGVTMGNVQADYVVPKIAFDSTVAEALDLLLVFGDYAWNINPDKTIDFCSIGEIRSPYQLDFTDLQDCIALGGSYTIDEVNYDYANCITLTGVQDLITMEEEFQGDGSATSWTVKRPIGEIISIKIDRNDGRGWVSYSFLPNTKSNEGKSDFLWDYQSNQFSQYIDNTGLEPGEQNGNIIQAGQMLKIEYRGLYSTTMKYTNQENVIQQKLIDGTSGINEIVVDCNIVGIPEARSYIKSLMKKYITTGYRISFITNRKGIKPLQYMTVIIEQMGINEDFLVSSVRSYEEDEMFSEITLVSGSIKDTYLQQLFGDREIMRTELSQRDGVDTVNAIMDFQKEWTGDEDPSIFNYKLYPRNDLYPSNSLFPAYPQTERLNFIQLYKTEGESQVPFLRVPIIGDSTYTEDGIEEYISFAVINEEVSFVFLCTSIAWIGSDGVNIPTATDFNSGILFDHQILDEPFSKVEDLETITIQKTDWINLNPVEEESED